MKKPRGYIRPEVSLGSWFPDVTLVPDGQWLKWQPIGEAQNLAIEPEACTSFGTLNAVEFLERQEFGDTTNWSDRFLAYASGTTKQGNNPDTVINTLKTKGDVTEADWPYTNADNTWNSFYETPPQALYEKALEMVAEYNFDAKPIGTDLQSLMNGLKCSPIGVAGFAWAKDNNGLYYTPKGVQPCHWFIIVGYEQNKYWYAFDSYSPYVKKLRWDYEFDIARQYTLHNNVKNQSAWQSFLAWFQVTIQQMFHVGDYSKERLGGSKRSPEWPKARAAHLKVQPTCQVCGGTSKLNVHHIRPFHLHPELELDPNNLITLCTGNKTINCHLRFGHWDNFRTKYNPHIIEDASKWRCRFLATVENENL